VARLFRDGGEHDSRVLGDDGYRLLVLEKVNNKPVAKTLDELVLTICKQYGITEAELALKSRARKYAKIRGEIALLALEHGIAGVTEVARRFGRSQPALSRTMTRLRKTRQ
jgi:chromosomal replication initiation ATPase DnaA